MNQHKLHVWTSWQPSRSSEVEVRSCVTCGLTEKRLTPRKAELMGLRELRELADAAPYFKHVGGGNLGVSYNSLDWGYVPVGRPAGEFIAAARTAVPALLDALEEAVALFDALPSEEDAYDDQVSWLDAMSNWLVSVESFGVPEEPK